jgi:uncharacterized protein
VTNPRKPLRLNIGFLIKSTIGTSRDFPFSIEKMVLGGDLSVQNLVGNARFNRTPQGLLLQGEFSFSVELSCVRCLDDFEQHLKVSFTDLYAFEKKYMSESNLLVPEDGQIDLELLLREYSFLEIPIKPICKNDCRGLCPVCGENLNLMDCGHHPESESPFSVLKDLLT